jgi:biopolymer transport protein ExbD
MASTGAGRNWRREDEPEEFGIPLAPLVDVVFLLLVFFLMETTFLDDEKDLSLALPRTAAGKGEGERLDRMMVNIRSDGSIYLGTRATTREGLFKALVEARRANPQIPVVLRGDKATSHGEIVGVLSVCQRARIRNVAVAVQDADGEQPGDGETAPAGTAER